MKEIKAPDSISEKIQGSKYLFLGGSIEMDKADNWQKLAVEMLVDTDWTILNPRRASWDSTWKQSKDNPQFREQVEWELNAQEIADKILMYLDPATKSPISLMELGLFEGTHKMIVVCPLGFWRKGNVDIVCERYGVPQEATLEDAIAKLKAL